MHQPWTNTVPYMNQTHSMHPRVNPGLQLVSTPLYIVMHIDFLNVSGKQASELLCDASVLVHLNFYTIAL